MRELLAVLKENNYSSAKDLLAALRHVEELENQLAGAVEQLSAMREEVQNLQKSPLKSALQSSVHTLEEKAASLKEQISALKESILTGCRQTLSEVREHGISALDNLARFFHLRQGLEGIRDTIQEAVQTDTRAIEKIEAMAAQYHEAGKHLKNAGRVLAGKEALTEAKPTGKVTKTIAAPFRADRACLTAMKGTVEKALSGLERLEQAAPQKPSTLKSIKEQSEKIQAEPAKAELSARRAER